MKLVHLSDLHLGYRQYQRLTPTGINQREADIARTFQHAVDSVIALKPDVVAIAGDVFHSVRPTNPAIIHAFHQLARLVNALPETTVVMVAGNHDTPRTTETGALLGLFRSLGILVADTKAERFDVQEKDLEILAVPDLASERPALTPNSARRYNIMVIHGEVEGVLPQPAICPERKPMEIPLEELRSPRWNYVALGHYHVYRELAPGVYYSGSLEYASTNVWGEVTEERNAGISGKGFIEHDLDTGVHVFHPVPVAREVRDLPAIGARGLTSPELDVAIRDAVNTCPGGIDGKILRLVVHDAPRHVARGLDHRMLREYRRRAVHFYLDARRPELIRTAQVSGAPGRRASLADLVRDSLRSRHIERDVDREELVNLGLRYLRDAEAAETPVLVEDPE